MNKYIGKKCMIVKVVAFYYVVFEWKIYRWIVSDNTFAQNFKLCLWEMSDGF